MQMAIDAAVVAASLAIVEPVRVAHSVVGSVAVNLVLLWNHRPQRPCNRDAHPVHHVARSNG